MEVNSSGCACRVAPPLGVVEKDVAVLIVLVFGTHTSISTFYPSR